MSQQLMKFHLLLAVLLLWLVAGCGLSGSGQSDSDAETTRITLTGSSTIAPLANEIGKRFEAQHPHVRVDVQTGGSSRGVADVRRGLASIGMVSRELAERESDLQNFTIARDGVCLIVHESNPIESLTDEQVVAIYSGQADNWQDVGGSDAAITVVNKAEGRSTLELFCSYFKLDSKTIQADVVIGDNEQGIKTVAGNPGSIGYVSIGSAEFNREHGVPIKLLPIAGIAPSQARVADGSFPLARPLNLVTRETPTGVVQQFIEFAQSAEVHDLVEELSFVPLQ